MIDAITVLVRNRPRWVFAAVLLVAWGLVGASLWLTAALNLHPCPLCIFQRLLYLLIGLIGLFGLCLPGWRRSFGLLLLLIALGGLGTAIYQSWMQAYPELAGNCGLNLNPNMIERLVDWLGAQWELMFYADGLCTSKEWAPLGFSIANWSVLGFFGFAVGGVFLVRR